MFFKKGNGDMSITATELEMKMWNAAKIIKEFDVAKHHISHYEVIEKSYEMRRPKIKDTLIDQKGTAVFACPDVDTLNIFMVERVDE